METSSESSSSKNAPSNFDESDSDIDTHSSCLKFVLTFVLRIAFGSDKLTHSLCLQVIPLSQIYFNGYEVVLGKTCGICSLVKRAFCMIFELHLWSSNNNCLPVSTTAFTAFGLDVNADKMVCWLQFRSQFGYNRSFCIHFYRQNACRYKYVWMFTVNHFE